MAAGAGMTGGTPANPSLGFGSGGVSSGGVGGFFENIGANMRGGLTGTMPSTATGIGTRSLWRSNDGTRRPRRSNFT